MPKFTREDLEQMTIRQLRLIDINSVDDERIVQEVLNSKLEVLTPDADISDLTKVDIRTPEQEAEVQAAIDKRRAEAKARMLSNQIPATETEAIKEDTSLEDGKTIKPLENNASEVAPEASEFTEHTVTEEDIINNPQLAEEGVEVGEKIEIPKPYFGRKELEQMKKSELEDYATEIGLMFNLDEVTNNPQRVKAILEFQKNNK